MQYKTELHVHTANVSPCADLPAQEVADRFLAAGYTTMVVTDHYSNHVIDCIDGTWEEKIAYYLSGYRAMKAYAKGRLHVLLGCELRFYENHNDYLVYGMDEEFLLSHPNLHQMRLREFYPLAQERGMLVIQAHPFRNSMTVMNPKYLDGIEVFNGHHGHDSRNRIALEWANRYPQLLRTSGSDFHHPHSVESGGILTDSPITSMEQLIATLRKGNYTLHCSGPAAELDGMTDMPAKN